MRTFLVMKRIASFHRPVSVLCAGLIGLFVNCAIDLTPGDKISADIYECDAWILHVVDSHSAPVYNAALKFTMSDGKWLTHDRTGYKETETYSRYDGSVPLDICGPAEKWTMDIDISHPDFQTVHLSVDNTDYTSIGPVVLVPVR